MAKSQELANFEQVVEKIIFNEDELEKLKIAIKKFTEGKTSEKELKQLLLQCRGRMVEEITDFGFFFTKKRTENLIQTLKSKQQPFSSTKVELQLKEEIRERNELLEIVAEKVNNFVSNMEKNTSSKDESLDLEDEIKSEIERVFLVIKVDEWLDMCGYDDYKFFIKFYNKLEALYRQKFGNGDKKAKNTKSDQEIMARKIVKLNFPKKIITEIFRYIKIRNNATHNDWNLTPSDMEVAHNAFVLLFIHLLTNSLDSHLLEENEKLFLKLLLQNISNRLDHAPKFLSKMERSLISSFSNFRKGP